VLLAVVGLLGAGAALAWALTGVGEESRGSTVVLTRTVAGEESTVVVTQTVEEETVERTVTQEDDGGPPPEPTGEDGVALNDRGFELLQAGNAEAALPVLESAVAALGGSSSIAEAYASQPRRGAILARRCDGVMKSSTARTGAGRAQESTAPEAGREALRRTGRVSDEVDTMRTLRSLIPRGRPARDHASGGDRWRSGSTERPSAPHAHPREPAACCPGCRD
jgi:hypothetical protein